MACLTVIGANRDLSCGAPPAAELGIPVGALIINASTIQSFTVSSGVPIATITMVAGGRGFFLETANNSTVINIAMKGGEVYPQQHDVSIETTLYNHRNANDTSGRAYSGGMNGQYVFAVNHGNGVYKIYGLGAPLETLSVEGSSNGNGYVRTTFGVEDWQTGTTIYDITKETYDALSVPATGGGGK